MGRKLLDIPLYVFILFITYFSYYIDKNNVFVIDHSNIGILFVTFTFLILCILDAIASISYYNENKDNFMIPFVGKYSILIVVWIAFLFDFMMGINQGIDLYDLTDVIYINILLDICIVIAIFFTYRDSEKIKSSYSDKVKNGYFIVVAICLFMEVYVRICNFNGVENKSLKFITWGTLVILCIHTSYIVSRYVKNNFTYYSYIMMISYIAEAIMIIIGFIFRNDVSLLEILSVFDILTIYSLPIIAICLECMSRIKQLNNNIEEEIKYKTELHKYYSIINTSDSNIIIFDEKFNIEYMNTSFRRILYFNNVSHPDMLNLKINGKPNLRDLFDNKSNNELESFKIKGVINIKQSRKFFAGKAYTVKDDMSDRFFHVVLLIDQTDNVLLTKNLINNEKRFRDITNNISDVIYEINTKGFITYCSPSFAKMFNGKVVDFIGCFVGDIVHRKDDFKFWQDIKKVKKTECTVTNESYIQLDEDKKEYCFEYMICPLKDRGKINGYIISGRDITRRKNAERKQLEESKKLEETMQYDKLRTEFFSNISHELRTPINVIFSILQVINLQNTSTEDYMKKYNGVMKQNCYRLLRLINNLIDITKIDAGYMNLSIGKYDIVQEVEDITQSVVPYAEAKNLSLVFDTFIEELDVYCDIEKIERIVLNLLSNAIKFTPNSGNIKVTIDKNEEYAVISVKDDGYGIPENMLNQVFERFRQVDKSFTRENEGSGIGLSLVKSLVELHKGKVELKSEINKGSEFLIYIPIDKNKNLYKDLHLPKGTKEDRQNINVEFSDIYDI